MTPELRKETGPNYLGYLSQVEYQIKALKDDAFKPGGLQQNLTDELRRYPDYRDWTLEVIYVERFMTKSVDDYLYRRKSYKNLMKYHPHLHAQTTYDVRDMECEYEAAIKGNEIPTRMDRKVVEETLKKTKEFLQWLIKLRKF